MTDLTGRRVMVTGASSGLGAQFARTMAKAGATVVIGARRVDRLAALAAEIKAAGGIAHAIALDVEDEGSIKAAFDEAEARVGGIDTLFNNAGISTVGSALDLPVEDFDKVFTVNVRGVFLCAREAARRAIAAGRAQDLRIINIASMAAFSVVTGSPGYSASKAAVVMLTKTLAREWARAGINVNAICPGYIETEINADWLADPGGQKMVQKFPRRRVMPIDALDGVALYLASDASAHTTGGTYPVDDGQPL